MADEKLHKYNVYIVGSENSIRVSSFSEQVHEVVREIQLNHGMCKDWRVVPIYINPHYITNITKVEFS